MIKRVLEIATEGAHLAVANGQLLIKRNGEVTGTVPVEDIGVLICDHPAITYTHGALNALLGNNCAVVVCGTNHHPSGLLLPLEANTLHGERHRIQAEAGVPVKKRVWQQLVKAKIDAQATVLDQAGVDGSPLRELRRRVRSGDGGGHEAQAARRYWPLLMGPDFRRRRDGPAPNNLLNYGYTALRAAVARALCGAGLSPAFGLAHRNRYNAFVLADDVMEPFRPMVDRVVWQYHQEGATSLTRETKMALLGVLSTDVAWDGGDGPLMVALHRTAASLHQVFAGECKWLSLPRL